MSQALYDSLLGKWEDFLYDNARFYSDFMHEDAVDDEYDSLVYDFQKEYGYSERTINLAFYGKWYDTFKDEFYGRLHQKGIRIIHIEPMEGDWDYGKKFRIVKGYWEEIKEA